MTSTKLLDFITSKQWPEALASALPHWRKARGPRLAAIIETLAQKCEPKSDWPNTEAEFRAAWRALAVKPDAAAVGALLATLDSFAFLPSSTFGPKTEEMIARVGLMAKWPADPRIASRLRQLLEEESRRARDGLGTEDLLGPALKVLAAQKDPRSRPWLERFITHNPSKISLLRDQLGRHASRHLKGHPDAEDPIWIDEVERAVHGLLGAPKSPSKSIPQLIASALEAPHDLSRRVVIGDALLEAGDPRGEFFALELAALERSLTPHEEKQRAKLQKQHRDALLGDLAPIVKAVRFHGGFAAELTLIASHKAPARMWKEAIASRWMSTVMHVDPGDAYQETFLQVLAGPFAELLRGVTVSPRDLTALVASPLAKRLEWLRVAGPPQKNTAALLKRLPSLRRLEVRCYDQAREAVDWALAAPTLNELIATVLVVNESEEQALRTVVDPATRIFDETKIAHLRLNDWSLRREGEGARLSWLGPPLSSPYEGWNLVAFKKQRELKLVGTHVKLDKAMLAANPSLVKAFTSA
jgi:hypothetical protein